MKNIFLISFVFFVLFLLLGSCDLSDDGGNETPCYIGTWLGDDQDPGDGEVDLYVTVYENGTYVTWIFDELPAPPGSIIDDASTRGTYTVDGSNFTLTAEESYDLDVNPPTGDWVDIDPDVVIPITYTCSGDSLSLTGDFTGNGEVTIDLIRQ